MKNERENRNTNNNLLRWLVILFVFVFIAVSVGALFEYYYSLSEARNALYHAKVGRLAAYSISLEYYGTNEPFSDMTSQTGFADSIEEKINELSRCPGEFRLLTTDKGGYEIIEMAYCENDYTVHIVQKEDGGYQWTVMKDKIYIE